MRRSATFFATLKAGTERSDGGLERLFITGVSPITLDDMTSGFTIGTNISLDERFNEMVGFTEREVRGLLRDMDCDGVWLPVVEFPRDAIARQTGIRDYLDGEKVVHARSWRRTSAWWVSFCCTRSTS